MSLVKETVDRLLKGYDIRLRPDFGGNLTAFERGRLHILAVYLSCVWVLNVFWVLLLWGVSVAIFSS